MRVDRCCNRIVLSLLVFMLLTGAARTAAQTAVLRTEFPARVTFGWAAPGVAAVIAVPLPADVIPEEVTGISVADGARVLGFSTEHGSRLLAVYLSPAEGEVDVSFDELGIELELGAVVRHRIGSARIVLADARPGPLAFERSLAAPAAGLYLAVALRNGSRTELLVGAVEYLPSELPQGRLLFSTGSDSGELLAALERAFDPAGRRGGSVEGAAIATPVEGFGWFMASGAPIPVPVGESLVLAWTADSLPAGSPGSAYVLQPVIEYSPVAADAPTYRLGLPAPLRAP